MFAGPLLAMAAPPQGGAGLLQSLIPMIAIVAIIYFVVLLPAKKKQQKVDEFLANLKVGDRVITTGGIYGQIMKIGDTSVQLQVADKLRIEIARAAIGGYQGQPQVVEAASKP